MKRILCSLLAATLPFGSVLADAPKSKNAKVTLVYQHELPNVPGKSIRRVLAWSHPCQIRLHLRDRARGGDPQPGQRRTGDDLQGRTELLRTARRPPRRQRQCQRDGAGQAPRGVRGGHERDGIDDPIRELTRQARRAGGSEAISLRLRMRPARRLRTTLLSMVYRIPVLVSMVCLCCLGL